MFIVIILTYGVKELVKVWLLIITFLESTVVK